jgi:uncharacterized protein YndB with AHSA1/START domain
MKIVVETLIHAPIEEVWSAYTTPEDIKQWNAASDDWHTTQSTVDLRVGGGFSSRMEAKDGSFGFDFAGTYTKVVPNKLIRKRVKPRPSGRGRIARTPKVSSAVFSAVFAAVLCTDV